MILVDWEIFQVHFMSKKLIWVVEHDDRWELFTNHEVYKVKCIVEKMGDQAENMMFIERYFQRPNVIKVMGVDEESVEQTPEQLFEESIFEEIEEREMVTKEDGEGEMVEDIVEEAIHKTVEYKDLVTSTDDEHYHYYKVVNGDGLTSGTYPEDFPAHQHKIEDNKILDFNGHIHTYGNGQ